MTTQSSINTHQSTGHTEAWTGALSNVGEAVLIGGEKNAWIHPTYEEEREGIIEQLHVVNQLKRLSYGA